MNTKTRLFLLPAATALLVALSVYLLTAYRVITFDRSEEIAGGLTTGGWLVERDSLGVVHRGYFIIFKDDTVISNNLTYDRVVPYAAIGDESFTIVLGEVNPDLPAHSVQVSSEDDQIVLTAPIPNEPHRWELYLRKVISDTSTGNYTAELLGKWRVFGADIFAIDNPIRDGDSGVIQFHRDGDVNFAKDRPSEISHGFDFPEVLSFGVARDHLLLETRTDSPLLYKIHSLGDLIVFERGEKVPWILVPVAH